jgi:adenylosuccinate synthase
MATTVLVGAQWGDEGKGKIIDVLARDADFVVRFQGGNNAGHTVKTGEDRYVLHLVPSGILHPGKTCVIGNGVVVDPWALLAEIEDLRGKGIDPHGRLFVSDRCHVIFPFHKLLDEAREQQRPDADKIGTTKRGIGPAYGDKMSRVGLRMGDLLDGGAGDLIRRRVDEACRMLKASGVTPPDPAALVADARRVADSLAAYVADTVPILNKAVLSGKNILLEGAQGTMLDIDFGTYPFVTSSNATAGGACTGSGISPARIDRVVGVIKAYTTRVGAGPFPTELNDETGALLRREGGEFGATTGRPRRCGWFDAVVARYSAMINGVDGWAMTKLDVLDSVKTIKICVAYELDGRRVDAIPASARMLERCRPVYEEWPGWMASTKEVARMDDLPAGARSYVNRLCELTGVPLAILSVGPKRDSTLRITI